ncbi:hypothetical protein HK405_008395 [Cladochytrium tenue]|nr:hypothetical protein HK405_008395 [Cladochytrium tenue]
MGLLSVGTPYVWEDAKKHADHVRKHGILQFIHIFNCVKDRRRDRLYWGDEVEYIVVHLDHEHKRATLALDAHDTLHKLEELELSAINVGESFPSSWKPEYGRYMLEGTPGQPYGSTLGDLLLVEDNMRARRRLAQSLLPPGEHVVTLTNFPMLGVPGFATPDTPPTPNQGSSKSIFITDEAINPHPRFRTLTANIRRRRGDKVVINIPIFKDENTPSPFLEPLPPSLLDPSVDIAAVVEETNSLSPDPVQVPPVPLDPSKLPTLPDLISDALPDHIYMDCMCFGMGCSCLQVTLQAWSPIFRGYLADVDCRWQVIAASVDDRTKEERSIQPLSSSRFAIPKSRYESISTYLSPGPRHLGCNSAADDDEDFVAGDLWKDKYNDIPLVHDETIKEKLVQNDIDELLARHYAHLFIRDPLVIFSELLCSDDSASSDHFENIQSTNWQTMRFKPPPPQSSIGWRVEFRSMEIQLNDYDNAAFATFVILLARTILKFNLNFYMPLSKVDQNMQTAQLRNAVLDRRFYFRRHVLTREMPPTPNGSTHDGPTATANGVADDPDELGQFTLDELINGGGPGGFPGLVPLVRSYLASAGVAPAALARLSGYLDVLAGRASGQLPTPAALLRRFVRAHRDYRGDSVVPQSTAYDLLRAVRALEDRPGTADQLPIVP